jgi:hypothetical protein
MQWIIENAAGLLPIVTGVIALAAAIAAVTPSKSDDRIVQLILDVVNKLGLNIGKAKNADDA